MIARYKGRCYRCHKEILPGQYIICIGPRKNAHIDCNAHQSSALNGPMQISRIWQSWDQYVDYVESLGKPNVKIDTTAQKATDFTGYMTVPQAIKLSRVGWPEGVETFRKLSVPMIDKVSSQIERLDPLYSEEPGIIDFGRYFDEEAECCLQLTPNLVRGPGKFVNICINGTVVYYIKGNEINNRGATILALIELLEYAGCRVQLTLLYHLGNKNHPDSTVTDRIVLKFYEQPLEWNRLAFTLAHPASFRCMQFRVYEGQPMKVRNHFRQTINGGYGSALEPLSSVSDEFDIYFESMGIGLGNRFGTLESSTEILIEHLKNQGVTLI